MRLALLVSSLLLLLPGTAAAGGLFTPDTGIVGLGRGGANVARSSDLVSGLYYNPAGLWQLDGLSVQGGLHLISTDRWFERSGGEGRWNVDADGRAIEGSLDEAFPRAEKASHVRPIPEGGIAFGFERPDLTVALGLYAPIAPIQSFDAHGPGRYRLIDQELVQGNISLSAGWRIAPWIAVGASFQLLYMELTQSFMASADFLAANTGELTEDPQWDVQASFTATALRPHFNVGLMFMPLPWLRIAASFEPPYRFEGQGSASLDGTLGERFFEETPLLEGEPIAVRGDDESVAISVGLPGRLRFGLGFEPVQDIFEFEIDFHLELWGNSGDVIASDVDMPLVHQGSDVQEPTPLDSYLDQRGLCGVVDCASVASYRGEDETGTVVVPASFRDTWSLRLGGEVRPLPLLGLRFGVAYEAPAISDDTLSLTMLDSHKVLAAGGLSLRLGAASPEGSVVDVHITYAHLFYAPRTVAPDDSAGRTLTLSGVPSNAQDAGTYGGSANQLGINIAGHFGAMHQRARRTRAEKEARRSPVPPGQRRSSTPASPPSVSR